jgi:hypothetical protein
VPSPPSEPVALVEPALPPVLWRKLLRGVSRVGDERLRDTYQTTFWFPFSDAPACLPELAALALLPLIPPSPEAPLIGVEWWLSRMRTNDVRVDFHRDRDERLALERGKVVHPRHSSVLFLNTSKGGLLAVTADEPNEDNPSCAPDRHDFALVRPSPNRFAHFRGDLTHGVLDANNDIPTGKLPGRPRLRKALILNWWHRAPLGIPRWRDTRRYRPLALQ